jgi:hypothetical protein
VLKGFTLDVKYRPDCSNSHNCPRSGLKNWGGDVPGAPRSYPGYHGRVSWNMPEPYCKGDDYRDYRVNEALGRIGIHTGTGGAGSGNAGYDVNVFLDDFPVIRDTIFKQVFIGELTGDPYQVKT